MLFYTYLRDASGLSGSRLEALSKVLSKYSFTEILKDFIKLNTVEITLEKIIMRAIDINQHIIAEIGKCDGKIKGYEDTFYVCFSYYSY